MGENGFQKFIEFGPESHKQTLHMKYETLYIILCVAFVVFSAISEISERHFYLARKEMTQRLVSFLYHAGYYARAITGVCAVILLIVQLVWR
jgi:hypothetical protein